MQKCTNDVEMSKCRNMQKCEDIYKNIGKYAEIFRNVQKYVKICKNIGLIKSFMILDIMTATEQETEKLYLLNNFDLLKYI